MIDFAAIAASKATRDPTHEGVIINPHLDDGGQLLATALQHCPQGVGLTQRARKAVKDEPGTLGAIHIFFAAMIVFFAYFYTANVSFKSDEVAENLKNQGGFVPGIRPGKKTEDYLDYVVARILVAGSAYLAAVCLLPEILRTQFAIPFYFGGTSVLIVVSVTMDTINQIQSHLLAHQYEGLIEKSQLRGKKRSGARKAPALR